MHRIELPAWAVERGRRLNYFPRIDVGRTALLVIDMQNAFMLAGQVFGNPHACDIVPNVNRLAAAVRAAGGRVVWTRQTISAEPRYAYPAWQYDAGDAFVRSALQALSAGDPGHALHADMAVAPADSVLDKHRYSAFIGDFSELDPTLRRLGVDTLIVAGTLTNCCCESSARDANMLGYKVLFASDATAAVTDAEHNAALLNLCVMFADVRSTAELIELLRASAGGAHIENARALSAPG